MKQTTPIHLLRSFEAAARHTSFTLAADELHITQAAISKQIKALEKTLNSQLFKRNAHGVSLTQSGERYWRDISKSLNNIDTITTALFNQSNTQKIRIRANISYSVEVLAEKVGWFKLNYPNLNIELTHSVWNNENRHENADIEIDYRGIDPADKSHYLLQQDKIFPLISTNSDKYKINELPTIHILGYYKEWKWWLDQLICFPTQDNSLREWALVKTEEIKHNKNIIRVDNSLIAYKLCAQGIGCVLARSSLAKNHIDSGQLKRIDLHSEFSAAEGFHAHLTESGRSKQACTEFFDYLIN